MLLRIFCFIIVILYAGVSSGYIAAKKDNPLYMFFSILIGAIAGYYILGGVF